MEMNGEPWFVGKDVAEALGYSNTRDTLSTHVMNEDKNTVAISDGKRGNPNQTIINESGLYALIFSSKLESAKRFKHWVTEEKNLLWYVYGEELYNNLVKNVDKKNICRVCGRRTSEKLVRGKCRYCSRENKNNIMKTITCSCCGKEMLVKKSSRAMFCENCRKDKAREAARRVYQKSKKKILIKLSIINLFKKLNKSLIN